MQLPGGGGRGAGEAGIFFFFLGGERSAWWVRAEKARRVGRSEWRRTLLHPLGAARRLLPSPGGGAQRQMGLCKEEFEPSGWLCIKMTRPVQL